MENRLRVLVVDDTITYRTIVSHALAGIPGVEVVGVAANGKIALQKLEHLHPDLLTLDVEMPEMNGLEVLRCLRRNKADVGAIMLSACTSEGAESTIEALELGAFDFVIKPSGGTPEANADRLRQELRRRIEAFVRSREIRAILHGGAAAGSGGAIPAAVANGAAAGKPVAPAISTTDPAAGCQRHTFHEAGLSARPAIVALGISTGGPQALTTLLPQLPADLAVPVLIVQHMPPMFTRSLADDLDHRCALHVCEAVDGQAVLSGSILIAPGGKQMKVERDGETPVVRITDDLPENSCRPSVDYLFRSVARVYGRRALGVIMTGMGNDGAAGCRLLHRGEAPILAQDEASCVVFGMPREPLQEGIAKAISLQGMAREIIRLVGQGAGACR
jgi:two-component system, chemotaxis family, protein-glutamate methylesterase/glutaminase